MLFFDPNYLLFMAPAFLFALWASFKTKSAFKKYSRVRSASGLTGAQAAQRMLASAGIDDVKIVRSRGRLSDHYNPLNKTLALSESVHDQPSIAAIGVACHEAGHALQHAAHYGPLRLRSALVPTAGIGSNVGYMVMFLGLVLQRPNLIMFGAVLFSAVLLFQLVTLPVEFDASARAKRLAFEQGMILDSERIGVSRVLNAAAMTYVAAAVTSFLTLLYFVLGTRD